MGEDTLNKWRKEPKNGGSQESVSTVSNNTGSSSVLVDTENEKRHSIMKPGQATFQLSNLRTEDKPSFQEFEDSFSTTVKSNTRSPKLITRSLTIGDSAHHNLDQKLLLRSSGLFKSTGGENGSQGLFDEINKSSPTSDAGFDEKNSKSEDERGESSTPEINSIMNQFGQDFNSLGHEKVILSKLEVAGPILGDSIQHPPRKSSLEPIKSANTSRDPIDSSIPLIKKNHDLSNSSLAPPLDSSSTSGVLQSNLSDEKYKSLEASIPPSLHRPPPPELESEPNVPFDFHRFLEQLRHKTADPVAKFLRSFFQEFGKKQWMVHEQVKIISDFLAFISNKMAQCEVWAELSDAEFDNAREGMEKLVMNRLYTQTFSPAISPPQPISGVKPRRKGIERPMGPGRRGQHQEDVERDEILAQKISIYDWIKVEHLDIQPVSESGRKFLIIAKKELLKIKTYRAPRDKIICVLNCCKVIFGLLKHSKSDSSADSFMPLLIYVVLQANPEHLVSNVQYILRFRNQEKLVGEVGYYISSLLGAVHFIENLDRTTLTISDEEFERNVEAAVSAIAEKHQTQVHESAQHEPELVSQKDDINLHHLNEVETPNKKQTSSEYETSDTPVEKAPIGSLLRTIQRPLSSIGWIFSEDSSPTPNGPVRLSQTESALFPMSSSQAITGNHENLYKDVSNDNLGRKHVTGNISEEQDNSHATDVLQTQRSEYSSITETLVGMFPDLDKEIIRDVVAQKEGKVELAVDVCLALSSG